MIVYVEFVSKNVVQSLILIIKIINLRFVVASWFGYIIFEYEFLNKFETNYRKL